MTENRRYRRERFGFSFNSCCRFTLLMNLVCHVLGRGSAVAGCPFLLMFSTEFSSAILIQVGDANPSESTAVNDAKTTPQAEPAPAKPDNQQEPRVDPEPLRKWIQGWFQPRRGALRANENPGNTDHSRSSEHDVIDSRAPRDMKVEQMLRTAETAIQRKDWKASGELLQRLLDLPEDSLHRLPDGHWQSVRRSAKKLLGSASSELLNDYRAQYSGLSQRMLASAKGTGRVADYVTIATRFFHTPAGHEAANYLGSMHLDRSEFGLAAAWFTELLEASADVTNNGAWRLKAAFAFRNAGHEKASLAMIASPKGGAWKPVMIGTGPVDPATWLNRLSPSRQRSVPSLSDWRQLHGTAARVGKSIGGDPLLSPIWSVPMTTSPTVNRQVTGLLQDLLDQDETPLLTSMPLVVEGHVLYRDLRGVRAVDIETGKTHWESIEGISPEQIIGGLAPQQIEPGDDWRGPQKRVPPITDDVLGQTAEYHPLTSLLFRDGTTNLISSDGRQVFMIENHGVLSGTQPGHHWGWDGENAVLDSYGVPWRTNQIASYDLRSGRPLWSIGGAESQEAYSLPMSGSYFHGVPAIDHDELLVVAEKGDEIRLWTLDRTTGVPLWSQLIAYSDTKIEKDIGRRWYLAQVGSEGGIVVCPTTVGWLVAVDRLRQSVMWAHRYQSASTKQERDPGTQLVSQRNLSSQWPPSAPMITAGVVVFTPPEEPVILALNVLDGRLLWEKPKETWLYLAGVFDEQVLLVGQTEIGAFALTTGRQIWTASLRDVGRPSGRGLVVENLFYQPVSTGEMVVLDIKAGKMLHRKQASDRFQALGNLAMHKGKLVALGPQGLVGFDQREATLSEIRRRQALNPTDAWALLHESELQELDGAHSSALPLLRAIDVTKLTESEKIRHHAALVESLATVIRLDPQARSDEMAELERLAVTATERQLHRELIAEKFVIEGRSSDAFHALLVMNDIGTERSAAGTGSEMTRTDDMLVSTQRAPWISGRLWNIWSTATGDQRAKIDSTVESLVAETLKTGIPQEPTAVTPPRGSATSITAKLLAFHPAATKLREVLVDDLAASGHFGAAQIELLSLAGCSDRTVAARAVERLARLMEQFQLPSDAAYYIQKLSTDFSDVSLGDGRTVAEFVQQRRTAGKTGLQDSRRLSAWGNQPLEIVQQGAASQHFASPAQDVSPSLRLPYYDSLSVEIHSQEQEQRLVLESLADGSYVSFAPLRGSRHNLNETLCSVDFLGHQIVIVNRDVLHVYSPIEGRHLWSKTLDETGDGGPSWRHVTRPQPQPMAEASRDTGHQLPLLQSAHFTGRLAIVQPGYLCVYGRRSISVLDPSNGEEMWRREGLPQYSQVVGHRDAIFILTPDTDTAWAFRALDGQPLVIEGLRTLLTNTLTTSGDAFVVLEQGGSSQRPSKTVLRLVNPLTQAERWKFEFPLGTFVSLLDGEELLIVSREGKAERIEIVTGHRSMLATLPTNALSGHRDHKYALTDGDKIYFVANKLDTERHIHHFGETLQSIPAHGSVSAWNRSDGGLIWSRELQHQNLIVERFRSLPVLLFVSRSSEQKRRKGKIHHAMMSVQAIHKESGTVLHDSTNPNAQSGFHSLELNPNEPSIELKSYSLRVKLRPRDHSATQTAPDATPSPDNN